jgi:hypothetical protein
MVANLVRVDPGSDVAVEREGERKGSAGGWKARSTSSLAHQLILNKQINLTNDPPRVSGISLIAPIGLCHSARISQLFCNSPYNRLRIWLNVRLFFLGGHILPMPIMPHVPPRPYACIGLAMLSVSATISPMSSIAAPTALTPKLCSTPACRSPHHPPKLVYDNSHSTSHQRPPPHLAP